MPGDPGETFRKGIFIERINISLLFSDKKIQVLLPVSRFQHGNVFAKGFFFAYINIHLHVIHRVKSILYGL